MNTRSLSVVMTTSTVLFMVSGCGGAQVSPTGEMASQGYYAPTSTYGSDDYSGAVSYEESESVMAEPSAPPSVVSDSMPMSVDGDYERVSVRTAPQGGGVAVAESTAASPSCS